MLTLKPLPPFYFYLQDICPFFMLFLKAKLFYKKKNGQLCLPSFLKATLNVKRSGALTFFLPSECPQ
jgi:hypothetical protein